MLVLVVRLLKEKYDTRRKPGEKCPGIEKNNFGNF
jgi:hypothetical protein